MNLRKEPAPKKKRGRPADEFALTLKGYIYVTLGMGKTQVDATQFYNNLETFAKKFAKKGQVPAIVFDGNGGTFIGVNKKEE